ncbi:MAG: hypothetical protein ACOYBQ_09500 [Fluviibacter sp.]
MDEQTRLQEAANLSSRIKDLNLAKFAREFQVPGGACMIYQHASGRRAISLKAGLAYAKGLSCALDEISPRLALLAQTVRNSTEDIPLQARTLSQQDHMLLDLFAGLTPSQRAEEIRRLVEAKEHNDELKEELARQSA